MQRWNVLLTSYRNERDFLLEELDNYPGTFTPVEFRDVLIGFVKDKKQLLEAVKENYIPSLSRLIPLDSTFHFRIGTFKEKVQEAIDPLTKKIGKEDTFAVRCERRGFEGELSSQEIEREIGSYVWKKLEARSINPEVDLEDPDLLIVIEIVGPRAGVGLIDKELREKYEVIQV
ncbi:MAG: hypothetical protein GWO20_08160 [Candidatus Korarchaeota archaeon]|nr:hypothetical protein [Candidatus Korarchaeota archaeon]NIU84444.1 hypothetical protein [Candidatus Thorarchaeota archaeon]NIW12927.1 hypothetical protein [Candidatus Thorarchaeota archaeon]NIW51891.1 hypothetical protein [Candidatus Korarchaeota archaeon]